MFWNPPPTEKFLDPKIVSMLKSTKGEVCLGGEAKELTMLGIGFLMPENTKLDFNKFIEGYYQSVDFLLENNVTIDRLFGSSIIAYFNHPETLTDHAVKACELAMNFADFWKKRANGIPLKIAINTGKVVVGNIGSGAMMNHTIFGDHFSLTEKVFNHLNGHDHPEIAITQFTKDLIGNQIPIKEIYPIQFSGEEISLYEVLISK